MTQHIKLILDKKEGILISEYDEVNNQIKSKFITDKDIQDKIGSIQSVQTPVLPINCIFYHRNLQNNRETIILEIPPNKGVAFYKCKQDKKLYEYKIPFPYTIFILTMCNGLLLDTYCFSSRGPVKDLNNHILYSFPLGNVYGDGKICWGSTRLGEIKTIVGLGSIPTLFFNAFFNGDLYHSSKPLIEYFQELSELETFPVNKLKKYGLLKTALERLSVDI